MADGLGNRNLRTTVRSALRKDEAAGDRSPLGINLLRVSKFQLPISYRSITIYFTTVPVEKKFKSAFVLTPPSIIYRPGCKNTGQSSINFHQRN